jgi:hypothetical protein
LKIENYRIWKKKWFFFVKITESQLFLTQNLKNQNYRIIKNIFSWFFSDSEKTLFWKKISNFFNILLKRLFVQKKFKKYHHILRIFFFKIDNQPYQSGENFLGREIYLTLWEVKNKTQIGRNAWSETLYRVGKKGMDWTNHEISRTGAWGHPRP